MSVVVFGTRSPVELQLRLRTVPLMWQATKWRPVISLHFLAAVLYNQTLTRKHTNVNTRTPTQPQHTQLIRARNWTSCTLPSHFSSSSIFEVRSIRNSAVRLSQAGGSQHNAGSKTRAAAQLTKHAPQTDWAAGTVALPDTVKGEFH